MQAMKPLMEELYEEELQALAAHDAFPKPHNWRLSPRAVRSFIVGEEEPLPLNGKEVRIRRKFYGDDALVERAIVTLAGNRGLMLIGEPGTAKTMLSELLSAAICGNSRNTVQGTAATTEDVIKYSWNYALLLAKGPVREALVPGPLFHGMEQGILTRFEELTRCPQEVQDSLVSVLSDKVINIPELGEAGLLAAKPGFNIIATANTRDRGVNEMSSALKRRFNFETVKPIADVKLEAEIMESQVTQLLGASGIQPEIDHEVLQLLATVFHELREGVTADGRRIDRPSSVMSTAEAVSVYFQSAMDAYYYGNGRVKMDALVKYLAGTVAKEQKDDTEKLRSYFNSIIKQRSQAGGGVWREFFEARKHLK
ncbi:ATP-binding protein [Ectobacillus ponti]|uniref:AAA family ATPase n=1 Tax=Ectobacillus ponti TaxID=2961894 RepID=A0AA42BQD0_9BACI|nr:AAA family ATPase [Ectobacillus ponti]MCP8969762.1 AAA family ATPase [Ectobacillus ponti]